jgi:hypothetical protein
MTRIAASLLVAIAIMVSGCGTPSSSPWPARTPFPLPSAARVVPLATAPPASPYPPSVAWACPAALLLPVRIVWDQAAGTVGFIGVDTGETVALIWPRGFSARVVGGRLEIVAPDGSIEGRDGEVLSELGGAPDDVCNVRGTLYPPAS